MNDKENSFSRTVLAVAIMDGLALLATNRANRKTCSKSTSCACQLTVLRSHAMSEARII